MNTTLLRSGQRSGQDGFTAIELLVATTLSTMMMIALLGVLGAISTQQKELRRDDPTTPWQRALENQLRWDLANSEWLQWNSRRLRLTGYSSHDLDSGEPIHRPAEVTYTITQGRSHTWLVRREAHLDVLNNRNSSKQLVCADIVRIDVQPLIMEADKAKEGSNQDAPEDSFDPDGCRIPPGVRVLFYTKGSSRPSFVIDTVLR